MVLVVAFLICLESQAYQNNQNVERHANPSDTRTLKRNFMEESKLNKGGTCLAVLRGTLNPGYGKIPTVLPTTHTRVRLNALHGSG